MESLFLDIKTVNLRTKKKPTIISTDCCPSKVNVSNEGVNERS